MPLQVLVEDLRALVEAAGPAEEPEIRVPELDDDIAALAEGKPASVPPCWS
jgi:hypothetical protein